MASYSFIGSSHLAMIHLLPVDHSDAVFSLEFLPSFEYFGRAVLPCDAASFVLWMPDAQDRSLCLHSDGEGFICFGKVSAWLG